MKASGDAPPAAALNEARALLEELGALDPDGRITESGRRLRALPLPLRLARMVLAAAGRSPETARDAADLAAVLVERGLGGDAVDLTDRVERFRRDRSRRAGDMRRMAEGWAKAGPGAPSGEPRSLGVLLTLAYPDRLAKARGKPGEYLMANGRGAAVEAHERLAREPYLAIAEIAGGAASARILAAAAIAPDEPRASATSTRMAASPASASRAPSGSALAVTGFRPYHFSRMPAVHACERSR